MSCLQRKGLERVPDHSHLLQSEFVSALLLKCTMRVCKSSARSTIVTYVNPRSLAPFLSLSFILHILLGFLCFCRFLSSASTLTFAIYFQLPSLENRRKTDGDLGHRKSHTKPHFSLSTVVNTSVYGQHFHPFEAGLVPLPSPR